MANATISGGTGAFVQTVPNTSSSNSAAAQQVATSIANLVTSGGAGYVAFNTSGATGTNPTTPVVGSVGGSTPTSLGNINLGSLGPNVVSLLINNTDTTTVANSQFSGGQSVVGGTGGLNFTDAGVETAINIGGGTNSVILSSTSKNALIQGDGVNTIVVNAIQGVTTVVGTGASTDTITGSAAGAGSVGGIAYVGATGSKAFINPTGDNVTVYGGGGGTQTVFGGTQVIAGIGGTAGTSYTAPAFTGKLTVVQGTGYFAAGSADGNVISASAAGSTTLVGGGNSDTMQAGGAGDILVAAAGKINTVMDGSLSTGGDTFWSGTQGTALMYGSTTTGDTFYVGASTVQGVGYKGTFLDLHTAPGKYSALYSLNNNVSNTVNFASFGSSAQSFMSIGDFLPAYDKLNIGSAQGALTIASLGGGVVTITTAQQSVITLYNIANPNSVAGAISRT